MSDSVSLDLSYSAALIDAISDLASALGIENFAYRGTIGVLETNSSGDLYIQNFQPDFAEYYIQPSEPMDVFVERVNSLSLEQETVKISFVEEDGIKSYFTIESEAFDIEPFPDANKNSGGQIGFVYNPEQMEFLEQSYGDVEPFIQIDLNETPTRADIGIQNSITGEKISYDSLSSLGSVSQEGFTISATTGSVTGLITEQTQVITDVGGLSTGGRDRTITNTGVSTQIQSEVASGVVTDAVTTSGY
jgi:hypothetical protein